MTSDDIEIRALDEQFTAVAFGPLADEELDTWLPGALASVRAYLERWGAGPVGDPFVRRVDDEVEAGYPASTPVGGEGDVEPSDLPAGDAAVVVVPAADVPEARAAVLAFVAQQGREPAGDGWEVLVDGDVAGHRAVFVPLG